MSETNDGAMCYVDGYVLPVKRDRLEAYEALSMRAGDVWLKHGALKYMECVGADLQTAGEHGCVTFTKAAGAGDDETVIFALITYRDKAHRDEVNKKVMADPLMSCEDFHEKLPFDLSRMIAGEFRSLVHKESQA